jgi:hypothetical protein
MEDFSNANLQLRLVTLSSHYTIYDLRQGGHIANIRFFFFFFKKKREIKSKNYYVDKDDQKLCS